MARDCSNEVVLLTFVILTFVLLSLIWRSLGEIDRKGLCWPEMQPALGLLDRSDHAHSESRLEATCQFQLSEVFRLILRHRGSAAHQLIRWRSSRAVRPIPCLSSASLD